jgi:hypothetical protein
MLQNGVGRLTTTIRTECMGGDGDLSQIKDFGSHCVEIAVGRAVYYCAKQIESKVMYCDCHDYSTELLAIETS